MRSELEKKIDISFHFIFIKVKENNEKLGNKWRYSVSFFYIFISIIPVKKVKQVYFLIRLDNTYFVFFFEITIKKNININEVTISTIFLQKVLGFWHTLYATILLVLRQLSPVEISATSNLLLCKRKTRLHFYFHPKVIYFPCYTYDMPGMIKLHMKHMKLTTSMF